MKIPVKCPICNDILRITFKGRGIKKECYTHPNHALIYYADLDDNVDQINLKNLIGSFDVEWKFYSNSVLVTSNTSYAWLPWFEPDLSDYYKLMDKIKTYLIFS